MEQIDFLTRFYFTCSLYLQDSKASEFTDVHNPATNDVISRTPKSTKSEMESAVESAKSAFEKWRWSSVVTRQQIMLKYQSLIRKNMVSILNIVINNFQTTKNNVYTYLERYCRDNRKGGR